MARLEPTPHDALTGGRWVPRGGKLVWDGPRPGEEQVGRNRQPVAKCGTDGGYHRHLRITKTTACDACKAAHREANRRYAA